MIKATVDFPGINPEPWTVPAAVRSKGGRIVAIKGGKNEAFQKALAEMYQELRVLPIPAGQELSVQFFFWRSTADGGNQADATNLLKAAEDALQGHLYANDRNNRHVSACIVAQGPDVEPRILIQIETFRMPDLPVAEPPARLPTVNASSPATEARAEDAAWREANDPAEGF